MLDTETKRRIDTARDILVGKVPDPKSQVEQITIALIYKFMDDMDREAEELGGERTFFSGEFEKYAWNKIFDPKIGGHELLNLYGEALLKLNINPNIPQLFRDIFKNAYLPYRDPETLKAFLKVIDEFTYDHSERLGDAFEYLLSVLGSQGGAGQFRTPRHIIDFMVEIIAPRKDETILDPACGTAGFLISSFKHILKHNSSNFDPEKDKTLIEAKVESLSELTLNSKKYKGDKLTPDERARLADNITGYDISPDMIRLSLVNMYLHGLNDPDIFEYDTLTSEDNWNKYANVILANPPFMSPKGGIRPHNRFTVKSNRSEVLFVDYMAEHLTPSGRAAIIVPEGIIFQSGTAYKQLRKMLVDDYLVGVISLPAGVFNPYSGVKTSIIWLDKTLAKITNNILFVKITADGFDLGAQRRPVKENSLPEALKQINAYKQALQKGKEMNLETIPNFSLVDRSKIAANGDYNLSGERYKATIASLTKYELHELGQVCYLQKGTSITKKSTVPGLYSVIAGGQKPAYSHNQFNRSGKTITVSASGAYAGFVNFFEEPIFASDCTTIKPVNNSQLDPFYLFHLLKSKQEEIYKLQMGMGQPHVYAKDLAKIKIPIPPLFVQQEIVSEIEGYQKIIDGARMVVENYKPQIKIDPEWEIRRLDEIAEINSKTVEPSTLYEDWFTYIDISSVENETGKISFENRIKVINAPSRARRIVKVNDILLSTVRPNLKAFGFLKELPENPIASTGLAVISPKEETVAKFLYFLLFSDYLLNQMMSRMGKGSYPSINQKDVSELLIPLPNAEIQRKIADQIDEEMVIVDSNKKLIEIYKQKVKDRIAEVWGE